MTAFEDRDENGHLPGARDALVRWQARDCHRGNAYCNGALDMNSNADDVTDTDDHQQPLAAAPQIDLVKTGVLDADVVAPQDAIERLRDQFIDASVRQQFGRQADSQAMVEQMAQVEAAFGEPGDTVQMIDRVVYRNGESLEEPYVEPTFLPDEPLPATGATGYRWHLQHLPEAVDEESYRPTRDTWGPLIVPEGDYILLGDNRDQSLDSRYVGFIPREVIRGKAMFIYFSVDRALDRPFPRILTAARWGRVGQVIH